MSPAAEEPGVCGVGAGLRGLLAGAPEDVDGPVRAQSRRALSVDEHDERERDGGSGDSGGKKRTLVFRRISHHHFWMDSVLNS